MTGKLGRIAIVWVFAFVLRLGAEEVCIIPTVPVKDGDYVRLTAIYEGMMSAVALMKTNGLTVSGADLGKQFDRTHSKTPLQRAFRKERSLSDLYKANCPSIGVVCGIFRCERCTQLHVGTSSGFFVTEDGRFLTNYHVVNQPKTSAFGVLTYDGVVHAVSEVLAVDKTNDLALIQVKGSGFRTLPIATGASVGDRIALISHPKNNFYTLSEGIVSSYVLEGPARAAIRRMTISADYGIGSSGAPVLDLCGNAIGLVRDTMTISASGKPGDDHGQTQMVVRHCVPADAMLKLLQ